MAGGFRGILPECNTFSSNNDAGYAHKKIDARRKKNGTPNPELPDEKEPGKTGPHGRANCINAVQTAGACAEMIQVGHIETAQDRECCAHECGGEDEKENTPEECKKRVDPEGLE